MKHRIVVRRSALIFDLPPTWEVVNLDLDYAIGCYSSWADAVRAKSWMAERDSASYPGSSLREEDRHDEL